MNEALLDPASVATSRPARDPEEAQRALARVQAVLDKQQRVESLVHREHLPDEETGRETRPELYSLQAVDFASLFGRHADIDAALHVARIEQRQDTASRLVDFIRHHRQIEKRAHAPIAIKAGLSPAEAEDVLQETVIAVARTGSRRMRCKSSEARTGP